MKKISNQIITDVKDFMLEWEMSTAELDLEYENVMVTLKFTGDVSEIPDKYREGHENRNFKVIVESIYITEFWDDEELNEEKRNELNNLLNEIL